MLLVNYIHHTLSSTGNSLIRNFMSGTSKTFSVNSCWSESSLFWNHYSKRSVLCGRKRGQSFKPPTKQQCSHQRHRDRCGPDVGGCHPARSHARHPQGLLGRIWNQLAQWVQWLLSGVAFSQAPDPLLFPKRGWRETPCAGFSSWQNKESLKRSCCAY